MGRRSRFRDAPLASSKHCLILARVLLCLALSTLSKESDLALLDLSSSTDVRSASARASRELSPGRFSAEARSSSFRSTWRGRRSGACESKEASWRATALPGPPCPASTIERFIPGRSRGAQLWLPDLSRWVDDEMRRCSCRARREGARDEGAFAALPSRPRSLAGPAVSLAHSAECEATSCAVAVTRGPRGEILVSLSMKI